MNRRRSLVAAISGVLLSASLVLTGGTADATVVVSRPGRPVVDPDGTNANGVRTMRPACTGLLLELTDARVDSALAKDLATLARPSGPQDDDQRQMERLFDDGVGGIITDHPAEARALLHSQGYVSSSPSGITEWMPATASTIDGAGGSRALAARLSVEYAGAVPVVEVTRLVRHVVRDLGRRRVAPARLLDVADARCRRELTDLIARGDCQSP